MAGVVDGQAVDQAITNAAFLYKNANDTSSGVYTLNAPTSGTQINDVQNSINVIINGLGGTQSVPATAYAGVPSGTIAAGDTHVTALIKLADKFFGAASAGGHTHSGVDGQGALVAAVDSIAATGMAALTGAVVIAGDGKFITIGESGQAITIGFSNYGLPDALAVSNSATAGINFSGGAIAGLSYCDWVESGFPPGFPATGHVYMAASGDDHFYSKTSASATRRIDATIAASGQSAIYGDAVLVAGSNVTLSQSGQNITLSSTATVASSANVTVSGSRGSPTLISNTGITFSSTTLDTLMFIEGNGGATTPSAISVGSFVGQVFRIISLSAASTVTLSATATNVNLNGAWVGDDNGALTLEWDGTYWYEMGRR